MVRVKFSAVHEKKRVQQKQMVYPCKVTKLDKTAWLSKAQSMLVKCPLHMLLSGQMTREHGTLFSKIQGHYQGLQACSFMSYQKSNVREGNTGEQIKKALTLNL